MGSTFICLILPLTPLTATSTLLKISNEILVLMLLMTSLYRSLVLDASFSATLAIFNFTFHFITVLLFIITV